MTFQKVVQDLLDLEMTQTEIATACKCAQSSISDIQTGKTKNPNFALGTALMNLHKAKTEEHKKAA